MKTWILTLFFTLILSLLVYVRGEAQDDVLEWDESIDQPLTVGVPIPFEGLEPKLINEVKLKDGTILKAKVLPNNKIILQPVGKDSHNGGGG